MTDREALDAAIKYIEERWTQRDVLVALAACRERLAQLPEKCEHGESVEHWRLENHRDDWLCSGKVYPAELVERIAWTICDAEYQEPMWRFLTPEGRQRYMRLAVAVLDALNGETP